MDEVRDFSFLEDMEEVKNLIKATRQQVKEKFAFLEEMCVEEIKDLIEVTKQQIEEKEGQVNQLKELIEVTKQQVEEEEMEMKSLKKLIRVTRQQIEEKEVTQVTDEVKQFTDEIIQFTEQCLSRLEPDEYCVRNSTGVSTTVLHRLYMTWCEIQGIECMTQRTFTMTMKSLGYHKDKGKCLVKSYVTGQVKDRQQIFYYYVPKIEDIQLLEQVREKLYEELLECNWPQDSEEYQQPHALFVWFNKKDK